MSLRDLLPAEATGTFLGRVSAPGRPAPVPVLVTGDEVRDASRIDVTVAGILDHPEATDRLAALTSHPAEWSIDDIVTPAEAVAGAADRPVLLAPIDLQVIKACGVTFAGSMIERLIEGAATATRPAPRRCGPNSPQPSPPTSPRSARVRPRPPG